MTRRVTIRRAKRWLDASWCWAVWCNCCGLKLAVADTHDQALACAQAHLEGRTPRRWDAT